jgi:hypothetical protein
MRQEMADHKGEVIERKAGGTTQGADDDALPQWLSTAACAAGWNNLGKFQFCVCAICGWFSLLTLKRLPARLESSRERALSWPGWCGHWDKWQASEPPFLRRWVFRLLKAPSIFRNRPTQPIPITFRYQTTPERDKVRRALADNCRCRGEMAAIAWALVLP